MRKLPTALLAAAGLALAAGAAHAASERMKIMQVALPDGSVAQIRYSGEVAPRVRVVPVEAPEVVAYDPFAEMERISAMMQARHEAMTREMAALQRQAATAAASGTPGVVMTGNLPASTTYSYTVVTSTGSDGCTQRVEWRSDGSGAAPKVTQASSGDCSAVAKVKPVVPAAAPAKPAAPAQPVAAPVIGQSGLPARAT